MGFPIPDADPPFTEEFREGIEFNEVGGVRVRGSLAATRAEVEQQRTDFLRTLRTVVLGNIAGMGEELGIEQLPYTRAEAEERLDAITELQEISEVLAASQAQFGLALTLQATTPYGGGLSPDQLEKYASSPYNYGGFQTFLYAEERFLRQGDITPAEAYAQQRQEVMDWAEDNLLTLVSEEGTTLTFQGPDGARYQFDVTEGIGGGLVTPPTPRGADVGPGFIGVGSRWEFDEARKEWYEVPFEIPQSTQQQRVREAERTLALLGQFAEPEIFAREQGIISQGLSPTYRPGDEADMFYGMDPAWIADVKEALWQAGTISQAEAAVGGWSKAAEAGMQVVMDRANHLGVTWEEAAGRMATQVSQANEFLREQGVAGSTGGGSQPRSVYKAPDYAYLKSEVRTLFQQALGRQPEEYELALLANQLDADYRSQYEADFAAQSMLVNEEAEGGRAEDRSSVMDELNAMSRAQQEAPQWRLDPQTGQIALVSRQLSAPEEEEEGGVTLEDAGTVRAVDPLARLAETMRTRYAAEIENYETRAEGRISMNTLMSNLARGGGMVGG